MYKVNKSERDITKLRKDEFPLNANYQCRSFAEGKSCSVQKQKVESKKSSKDENTQELKNYIQYTSNYGYLSAEMAGQIIKGSAFGLGLTETDT